MHDDKDACVDASSLPLPCASVMYGDRPQSIKCVVVIRLAWFGSVCVCVCVCVCGVFVGSSVVGCKRNSAVYVSIIEQSSVEAMANVRRI